MAFGQLAVQASGVCILDSVYYNALGYSSSPCLVLSYKFNNSLCTKRPSVISRDNVKAIFTKLVTTSAEK